MLNIFNEEWGQEHQRRARHHMLQTEMMYRQQQQPQQPQDCGGVIMGGSVVDPDPLVEHAAAAAAAASEAAAYRVFVTRHQGQDIICSGTSITAETGRENICFYSPPAPYPQTRLFSLDEHRAKYKRASENAWR